MQKLVFFISHAYMGVIVQQKGAQIVAACLYYFFSSFFCSCLRTMFLSYSFISDQIFPEGNWVPIVLTVR